MLIKTTHPVIGIPQNLSTPVDFSGIASPTVRVGKKVGTILSRNYPQRILSVILEKIWERLQELKLETIKISYGVNISGDPIEDFENLLMKLDKIAYDLQSAQKYSYISDTDVFTSRFETFNSLCTVSLKKYVDPEMKYLGCPQRINLKKRLFRSDLTSEELRETEIDYEKVLKRFYSNQSLKKEITVIMHDMLEGFTLLEKDDIVQHDLILGYSFKDGY